jgi:general secretion pathway protein F
MTLYYYDALRADGKKKRGVIDADSLEAAKKKLRQQEIIVTKIFIGEKEKELVLSREEIITFTQELMQLLRAGLPLFESLLTIQEKNKKGKNYPLFLDLADKVKQGKRLSVALARYSKTFDSVYISMVAAGENSGELEETFKELYLVIARNEKFRRQLQTALVYPAFLSCFCLCVLAGIFFFLIPSIRELYEGRSLHKMTSIMLAISDILQKNWLWIVSFLGVLTLSGWLLFKQKRVIAFCKKLLLSVPLLKTVITEAVMMRFCRCLGVLLSGGVSILEALHLSKRVMNHDSFEEVITNAEEGLMKGRKISEALASSSLIPPMVVRMLSTSEEAGNSKEMLRNIADIYEDKLEKSLTQFTNLLQPVMLLLLGIIVGVILLSVLLPLIDVSSLSA